MLLDEDQQVPQPLDSWQLKYRFYFEEFKNQSNLYRVWWSTEATNNEYDVPEMNENPPEAVDIARVMRSILADSPIVTDWGINWDLDAAAAPMQPMDQPGAMHVDPSTGGAVPMDTQTAAMMGGEQVMAA